MNGSSWLRFAQRSGCSGFLILTLATSTSAQAEIRATDCARAAKYSESKRGVSMLVMQNGRTIFEHYAKGGSARGRWPIFSGTKSFWGIAALAAVRDGLFKLDDLVSDTITEWKGDPLPATGFELTAREWARLGELVLGQGSYHGRQIFPAALLLEAFAGSQANPSYGL